MGTKFTLELWSHDSGMLDSDKTAYLLKLTLRAADASFDLNDIIGIAMRLGFSYRTFDRSYGGTDDVAFASNDDYDLSLFYVDRANELFMSIVCYNPAAQARLDSLIQDIKTLDATAIIAGSPPIKKHNTAA